MPEIVQRFEYLDDCSANNYDQNSWAGSRVAPFRSFKGSSITSDGFWLEQDDDANYNQLQKFWSELTPLARQKLMRIDKQTLFENARKNMYCSRCNGLLLEGFFQIVMYGKSLQQDASDGHYSVQVPSNQNDDDLCMTIGCQDEAQDPSVFPWGGLTTTRDGTLTLLDCYMCSKSLKGLQNVFDSARARERERELLYPDACGGGGRGWISQATTGYGRGHGARETCALHTARLSVETLTDFWSALGKEAQQSLMRMKEDDFVERLMYRFDRKRFCRDCRKNVVREFKELKELKRMRREPHCTIWFCASDPAFQYEVSFDTVQADWHQIVLDGHGDFHHFEWAIGTGEGKYDIQEFENVGLSVKVQVNGLDLSGLNSCYITLRTWKNDGRHNEFSVKAHAMQGKQCVHCRLVVGDGCVSITTGESIRRFFEHAEEADEDEDDDCVDKDGNELDGDCSRPQKHAKSPELAREFLLDAATVIFKEQVEKAFREGTARQNAHSVFVYLALKLLEERVHVACKEIITLEKQMKLVEEEEKEKRDEEERKVRKKTKEREKKLRKKERLKEKEKREEICFTESSLDPLVPNISKGESTPCVDTEVKTGGTTVFTCESGETHPTSPLPQTGQKDPLMKCIYLDMIKSSEGNPEEEFGKRRDLNNAFLNDRIVYSRRKLRPCKDDQQDLIMKWSDRKKVSLASEKGSNMSFYEQMHCDSAFPSSRKSNGYNKQLSTNAAKSSIRNGGPVTTEKIPCADDRIGCEYDSHACSCKYHKEIRSRPVSHPMKVSDEPKYGYKLESSANISKFHHRASKSPQLEIIHESNGHPRSKSIVRLPPNTKKVWEPLDSRKKYIRSNMNFDSTLRFTPKAEPSESDQLSKSSDSANSDQATHVSVETILEDRDLRSLNESEIERCGERENMLNAMNISQQNAKAEVMENDKLCSITESPCLTLELSTISSPNSNNCSSCLSEGDSSVSVSNSRSLESTSTSDSEEASQNSEGRETSCFLENGCSDCQGIVDDSRENEPDRNILGHGTTCIMSLGSSTKEAAQHSDSRRVHVNLSSTQPSMLPHYALFQAPAGGYYRQRPVSWTAGPTNRLMPFPHANHYLFPNTIAYDLDGSAQFLQYGNLQHLGPPLLNSTHLPIYQPVAQINGVNANMHLSGVKHANGQREVHRNVLNEAAANLHPTEPSMVTDVAQSGKSGKEASRNRSFSLFHSGGPVALSKESESDPISLREGTTLSTSNLSESSPDDDLCCNKKASFEEYNLFASSNGLKFSFSDIIV